jgi:hypothetical protein
VVELDDSKSSSSESTSSKGERRHAHRGSTICGLCDLTRVAYLHPYHLLNHYSTPQMMQHGSKVSHPPVESKTTVRGVVISNVLAVSICLDEAL